MTTESQDVSLISGAADLVNDQIDAAVAVLRKRLRSIVVGTEASKPKAVGSGLLLQVGERYFCVSAAHVFDDLKRFGGGGVFLPSGRILSLAGPYGLTESPNGKRKDDIFDVGVSELSKDDAVQLGQGHFLTVGDLAQDESHAPRYPYMMLGYPGSRTKLKRDKRDNEVFHEYLSKFWGYECSPDAFTALGISRATHVLVDVDRRSNPKQKKQPDGPELPGLSGGGMWRLPSVGSRIAEDERPKLVAVFIENPDLQGATLLGTRVAVVVELLRKLYPELDSSLPIARSVAINFKTVLVQSPEVPSRILSQESGEAEDGASL